MSVPSSGSRPSAYGWLPYAAVFVAFTAVLLGGTHTWVSDARERASDERIERLGIDVGRRLHEFETAAATVLGVHHGETGLDQSDLQTLIAEWQAQSAFVRATGQARVVAVGDRERFERDMSERGLFDFHINDLDASGIAAASPARARHYPITMLEPMEPENLNAIGADLGTLPQFASELWRSIESDQPFLTVLPSSWPFGGHLVHVVPAFDGESSLGGIRERVRRFAAAYWVAGDLSAIPFGLESPSAHLSLTFEVDDGASRRIVFETSREASSRLWLTSLFEEGSQARRHTFGSTALVVTLASRTGFGSVQLLGLSVTTLLAALTAFATAASARERRRSALERDRAGTALLAERQKAETTLNSIADAVITLDHRHRVTHLNAAAIALLDTTRERAAGVPVRDLIAFRSPDDDERTFDLDTALDAVPDVGRSECDLVPLGVEGDERVTRLTLTRAPVTSGNGTGGAIVVLRDVGVEVSFTRRLAHQANHDQLTGLTNRYHFESRLTGLVDSLPGSGRQHALCYVDLDQFKAVNDTCGHTAGDRLLCELTENLKAIVRAGDVLSRLGGDEFGLLIVDADQEAAERVANEILLFFQSFVFRAEDKAFAVRASIGFVGIDEHSGGIEEVLAAADKACYAAKEGGRDSLHVYDPNEAAMAERSTELNWLPRLRDALDQNRFRLVVQPVASIGPHQPGGQVTHFEFLLRMLDEDDSEIAPWQFIKAAERYDLMREIDRWVIRNAFATVADIGAGPGADCSWSINLSGQSVADPSLVDYVLAQVERHGVPLEKIWFELTETAAISHFSVARDLIERVRGLGAKMALDDFGSGLSSFGYLKNLPVDVIKIDGQFVRDIATSAFDREMVCAIGRVAATMGIETVAEFVEDQATLDELVEIGIDHAQGYHVGRPCRVADALARLEPHERAA